LPGSPFEIEVAENNADYIQRYLERPFKVPANAQEVIKASVMPPLVIEGFTLSCTPHLLLKRVNRRNVPKMGIGFFRYSRGKSLPKETAEWQGAIAHGYLKTKLEQGILETDPEITLCTIFDVWSGRTHSAPTNSVYRFNEIIAVCAGLAQRWDQIPPPHGAIF
jgi:hypothetical protein